MEHLGGRSGSGRGSGQARPRPIRGGRALPSAPYGGRGLSASPEVPSFDMSSSPSGYLSSSPSLYMSSSPSTDPQQGGQQHTASPQSHVREEGSSSDTPIWGSKDPSTGKLWICPESDNDFVPHDPVMEFISAQVFRNYNEPWARWTKIPKVNRDAWFNEFLDKHMTLPEHRADLKKAYNHRAGRWLSQKLYALRRARGKKDWLSQDTATELFDNWATDENFQNISAKNKENRAKMDGPSYAGGSIPVSEHRRKVGESGEVAPGMIEWVTFQRTHSRQSEGSERQWINPKAQQVAETFQKLSQERDPASSVSDNESLFFEATGGFNKKGRVFGYGASASRLKQTKRSSSGTEGVSSDELKKMKALVQEQATQMSLQAFELTQTKDLFCQTTNELTETRQLVTQEQTMRQQLTQEQEMMKQQMIQEREMMQQRFSQQAEMMRQMQLQLKFLMKDKGSGSAPGDDDHDGDDDDHNAAV